MTEPTDDAADQPLSEQEPPPAAEPEDSPVESPGAGAPVTGIPASSAEPVTDYSDAGVPSLGYLQDKIDKRYGTALGATELAAAGDEAKAQQKAAADREQAAQDRLQEIRRSLQRGD